MYKVSGVKMGRELNEVTKLNLLYIVVFWHDYVILPIFWIAIFFLSKRFRFCLFFCLQINRWHKFFLLLLSFCINFVSCCFSWITLWSFHGPFLNVYPPDKWNDVITGSLSMFAALWECTWPLARFFKGVYIWYG